MTSGGAPVATDSGCPAEMLCGGGGTFWVFQNLGADFRHIVFQLHPKAIREYA